MSAASDHQTRQRLPTDYSTMTPLAYTREDNDTKTHSNQHTARMLTCEDKRVSAPDLNLQIDGDQSVQTRAEQWDQSQAKEINSLIQMGAVSPIHNGADKCRSSSKNAHAVPINDFTGFATITTKLISSQSNFRRHYTNKRVGSESSSY